MLNIFNKASETATCDVARHFVRVNTLNPAAPPLSVVGPVIYARTGGLEGGVGVDQVIRWLREDPFGPEIFGMGVEILIFVVAIPIIAWLWRRAGIRRRISERADALFAKFRSLQEAARDFARTVDEAIRRGELLSAEFGVTEEDIARLFDTGVGQRDALPDHFSLEEKKQIESAVAEVNTKADGFNEAAAEMSTYLSDRSLKHNVGDARDLVLQLRDAVRYVNSYTVRHSLLRKFEDDIAPVIRRVQGFELRVGPKRYRSSSNT